MYVARCEYEIKKSRFIGYVFDILSKDEVKTYEQMLRKEHKKSTHICHAYSFYNNQSHNSGFNDDGEPSGTAGRPIARAIQLKSVENIAVFVVRYYGGIKLGGGGLIRAYNKCANLVIDEYINIKRG